MTSAPDPTQLTFRADVFGLTMEKLVEKVNEETGVGIVTRFGEISPLWQNFPSLWQISDSLFLIWQNVEPTLTNLVHH